MPRTVALLSTLLLGVAFAGASKAELSVGGSVDLNGAYVWRGITVTNGFVVQPGATLAVSNRGGTLTYGVWMNAEPQTMDGANDLSQTGGARTGVAETDLTVAYSRPVRQTTLSGGLIAYVFDSENGAIDDAFNTEEVFAKADWTAGPGAPSLAAYADISTVHGVYLEAKSFKQIHSVAATAINATLVLGVSVGQEKQGTSDRYYNFRKSGLTHVELGIGAAHTAGPIAISPMLHLQWNPSGQNTRMTGARAENQDEDFKVWVGLGLAFASQIAG